MQYRCRLAAALLILLAPYAQPQLRGGTRGGPSTTGNLHVHVIYGDDRRAGASLLVLLMQGSSGTPVGTTFTNDKGEADFLNVQVGYYHVTVSGEGVATTESELFEVDERRVTQIQYVTVRHVDDGGEKPLQSKSGTVSATDLNVPPKARKELDKANELMAQQEWKKALERLNKAIGIYPQYATAYNNLGVLYSHMNDDAHEQEALEKAISLDDHLAAALLNLGKLRLRQKNFPQAEAMLDKAITADPSNAQALMLLADAQYMNQHYEAAIASARQAHNAQQAHPSFVHYIAARAYQRENRPTDALVEFQLFLKEEPSGPRADHVRGDIARMQRPAQ
jgi:tetratricopeptide (TPR) repeat protein